MREGKVIFIGGNKRAGKTTLSIKLHNEANYNYYDLDKITDSMEEGFPFLNPYEVGDTKYYDKFFECLIKSALDDAKNYGVNSVFNYIFFEPKYMSTFKYKDDIDIYYLANLDANRDNIKSDMIRYSKEFDWPSYASIEDLDRNINYILNRNISLKEECERYNFRLINTSRGENREIILNNLFNEIVNKNMEYSQRSR